MMHTSHAYNFTPAYLLLDLRKGEDRYGNKNIIAEIARVKCRKTMAHSGFVSFLVIFGSHPKNEHQQCINVHDTVFWYPFRKCEMYENHSNRLFLLHPNMEYKCIQVSIQACFINLSFLSFIFFRHFALVIGQSFLIFTSIFRMSNHF